MSPRAPAVWGDVTADDGVRAPARITADIVVVDV
jgi:hypothetical protein